MELGIDPRRTMNLHYLPRWLAQMQQWRRAGGKINSVEMVLGDYNDYAGNAKGHYFHQDLVVAQHVFRDSPDRHIDIGSRIDGFVALLHSGKLR